jgi:hypothetical protein
VQDAGLDGGGAGVGQVLGEADQVGGFGPFQGAVGQGGGGGGESAGGGDGVGDP